MGNTRSIATGFDFQALPDGNVLLAYYGDDGQTLNEQVVTAEVARSISHLASLDDIVKALEAAVDSGDLGAIRNGVLELNLLRIVQQEAPAERVEDYAAMSDETLIATAQQALREVHCYEIVVLHGSSRRERAQGRAAKDRLLDVCFEIGLRHLAKQFREAITGHQSAYKANLKEVGAEEAAASEKGHVGRLSWWNV